MHVYMGMCAHVCMCTHACVYMWIYVYILCGLVYIYVYIYNFVCWSFTSWRQLMKYQNGYRLVKLKVCSHDDFIVLPYGKIRLPAPWINISLGSHYPDTEWATSSPYPNNKYQVLSYEETSINFVSHCFDLTSNWTPSVRLETLRSANWFIYDV